MAASPIGDARRCAVGIEQEPQHDQETRGLAGPFEVAVGVVDQRRGIELRAIGEILPGPFGREICCGNGGP
jgi:hypothetical protein